MAAGCRQGDKRHKMRQCRLLTYFYSIYRPDLDILRLVRLKDMWRLCQTLSLSWKSASFITEFSTLACRNFGNAPQLSNLMTWRSDSGRSGDYRWRRSSGSGGRSESPFPWITAHRARRQSGDLAPSWWCVFEVGVCRCVCLNSSPTDLSPSITLQIWSC